MLITRSIVPKIKQYIGINKIIILKGTRQVGKTTILKYLKDDLSKNNKETFYISADEDFDNSIFKTPQHFIALLENEVSLEGEKSYVFIDEFQYIKNAGQFLKVLYDKYSDKIQFIVSGSSSLEITKNTEFLTGRKIEFYINHISFLEYLTYKNPKIANAFTKDSYNYDKWKLLYEVHKNQLEILFAQFARFGSYPEILTTTSNDLKKVLIRELFSTYIQKDIVAFLKIENISAFNNLIKVLSSEVGNMLNKQSLANTLRISINTLCKYIDILKGTYVCSFLPPFYKNARKEVSKMQKVFVNDNGLRNYIINRFPAGYDDIDGQDAENIAFSSLRQYIDKENLFYFRTLSKSEIDFIIDYGSFQLPVEIKFRNKATSVPVAMQNFKNNYKTNRPIIVTKQDFIDSDDSLFIPIPLFELYLSRIPFNILEI